MSDLRLPLGKSCTKCKAWKLFDDFHRCAEKKDGRQSHCKCCILAASYLRHRKNKKKRAEQGRRRYQENKERILEQVRLYRKANKEHILARDRRYYERNREAILEKKRIYSAENSEQRREYIQLYREQNPEALHERERINRQKRRAAKLGNGGSFTKEQWIALKKQHNNRCLSCGELESLSPLTVDHVVPLCKGGPNDIGNIQPLCRLCNSRKHKQIIDYR